MSDSANEDGTAAVLTLRARGAAGRAHDTQVFGSLPLMLSPVISSQRNASAFSNVTLSMLFKGIYELAGIRTSSHSGRRTFATRLSAQGVGMRTIQKLMGHRHIGTTALYCDVSDETLRNTVELV